ncbi:hypothetical protein GGI22_002435 [Coemansia erecta]|nr:hypothetical protein GGI22_002435 [Coemansia erecta]
MPFLRYGWQTRGYALPLVGEGSSLDHELDIPKRVHQIVNPSKYSIINLARDVSQSARLENQDIGQKTEGAIKVEKELVKKKLDDLFNRELKPSNNPARSDLDAILEGYYIAGSTSGCLTVLRTMRECDITPSRSQYKMVLTLACSKKRVQIIYSVAEEMRLAGLEDTNENYESFFNILLLCLGKVRQDEMMYSVYLEMRERGLVPSYPGAHETIVGLAWVGEMDLALQVLQESIDNSIAFTWRTYMDILASASFYMHHKAYKLAYTQLLTVFGLHITKGEYDAGLSIASRVGDYKLATSILEALGRTKYPIRGREYEALFDSLLVCKQWGAAFRVLGNMRKAEYGKTAKTLRTLVRALTMEPEKTEKLVGKAYEELLKASRWMPELLDTITLNAFVGALAQSGYVEAAFMKLSEWFDTHSIKRSIETYVAILAGCVNNKGNSKVAEMALGMMLDVDKFEPTKDIYELMIRISLKKFNYEDAFVYLDSMKAQKMAPDWLTYASIVRRCANVRDPRAKVALEEMRSLGYVITASLEHHVASRGTHANTNYDNRGPEHGRSHKEDNSSQMAALDDILGADVFRT